VRALVVVITLLFTGTIAACATQPQRLSDTRWPEVVMATDRDATRGVLITGLVATGWELAEANSAMVRYRVPDADAKYNKAAYGCTTCADPYISLTFILSEAAEGTRVTAQYWRVIPKFGGAEGRHEMTRRDDYNMVQDLLWRLREESN
jgi:hypothetical protein